MLCREGIDRWNRLRFGLVLSGGGAKGAYEAGAVRAMRQLDVANRIYGVSGTSVGALNTLVFAMNDGAMLESLWENVGLTTVVSPHKNSEGESRSIRDLLTQITGQLDEDQGFCTQDSLRRLIQDTCDFSIIRSHRAKLFACAYDIGAKNVTYFDLKELSDEEMVNAVLASAAIPHVYDPVTVLGRKYADGGINDPVYGIKNSDVTPIYPLQDEDYDIMIVIHLREQENRDITHIGKTRLLHVYPSRAIEPVKGTGTMLFTKSAIRDRLSLGYSDMCVALSSLLMEYLKED